MSKKTMTAAETVNAPIAAAADKLTAEAREGYNWLTERLDELMGFTVAERDDENGRLTFDTESGRIFRIAAMAGRHYFTVDQPLRNTGHCRIAGG